MKLTIDTDKKTVSLVEKANVFAVIEALKKLLPDGEWKNYTIETNVTVNWQYPIYIPYNSPIQPIWQPDYYYKTTCTVGTTANTYCVELEEL